MSLANYTFPPKYNMIKDFDLYETQEYPVPQFVTLPFKPELEPSETKESDFNEPEDTLKIQNQKFKKQRVQTSFQNKFLDQHIQSLEKHIFQFLVKSFPQFKTAAKQSILWNVFGKDPDPSQSTEKLNELVRKDNQYFDEKQLNKFLTQIFYKESLYEFLSLVCNNVHSRLALEIAFISSFFCEVYTKSQQTDLKQDQIEKMVDQALESEQFVEYLKKIQFLSLKRSMIPVKIGQYQLDQNIKKLLKVLGNTIILVMQEYFINRFLNMNQNSQQVRRSFNFMDISNDEYSDDENDFHFYVACKKRKP